MSKTKPAGDGHYEMLFIISNQYTEEEAKNIIDGTNKLISKEGGAIIYEEFWGKKKLAYPIKHNHFGYYQLVRFDLNRKNLQELNNLIRLSDKIIRHQIIKIKKQSLEEILKEKKKQEELNQKEKDAREEKNLKNKRIEKNTTKEEIKNKKTITDKSKKDNLTDNSNNQKKVKRTSQEEKEDLKNLDDKLQGILDAQDLLK